MASEVPPLWPHHSSLIHSPPPREAAHSFFEEAAVPSLAPVSFLFFPQPGSLFRHLPHASLCHCLHVSSQMSALKEAIPVPCLEYQPSAWYPPHFTLQLHFFPIFISVYSIYPHQAFYVDSFLCSLSSFPLKNSRKTWSLSKLQNRAWNRRGTQFIFVKSVNRPSWPQLTGESHWRKPMAVLRWRPQHEGLRTTRISYHFT